MKVAALYVDLSRGPYSQIDGVDCWGWASKDGRQKSLIHRDRDAQQYQGPAPVIAHPPCGPWGRFSWNYKGGEGSKACGLRAAEQERAFGGVLEHPANAKLWAAAGLPEPTDGRDLHGGFTVLVNQCDWGHPAVKPTWLYIVGARDLPKMPPPGAPTHVMVRLLRNNNELPELCKADRHLTPPLFARWLVQLARSIRRYRLPARQR